MFRLVFRTPTLQNVFLRSALQFHLADRDSQGPIRSNPANSSESTYTPDHPRVASGFWRDLPALRIWTPPV